MASQPRQDAPYDPIKEHGFRMRLLSDPPGVLEVPGLENTIVSIHVGPSVRIACRRGGHRHCGTTVHGDVDVIPAGMPSVWELKETDTAFIMSVAPWLLASVAEQLDMDPDRLEIQNRFQIRDAQIENIGWALKAEMEAGYPGGRLYLDSLGIAIATSLVQRHSAAAPGSRGRVDRLSDRRLRQVLAHIEDNIGCDLSLGDLAGVAGLSLSHFKTVFRESVGVPVHQYLIRRRVERAKMLLGEGKLPISQIALEVGFAHQSHLARHMRRLLGVSPSAIRDADGR